jgi:hypothetical protein
MEATELCEIMGRYGSDKGHKNINECWHNYTQIYYKLFNDIRNNKLRVFELGLGTNNPNMPSNMGINGKPGASLYGWKEFFPNSNIYGADIDRDILFETERIKTYYCDQTNPEEIKKMWNHRELWEPFDIIVEDGLHSFDANVCFFENSIYKLKRGGFYIIEDIVCDTLGKWSEKIKEWQIKYPEYKFKLINLPCSTNNWDNILLVIQFKPI